MNRSHNLVKNALERKPRQETNGRPLKTTKTLDHYIVTLSKKDSFKSSKAIAAQIGNSVSAPTIRRRLQDANLAERIARKVPLMRKKNITMRQTFAREHNDWVGCTGEKNRETYY